MVSLLNHNHILKKIRAFQFYLDLFKEGFLGIKRDRWIIGLFIVHHKTLPHHSQEFERLS